MKILLLEDNNKLNETITKRLKIKNYNVISFTDGSDAYENITEDFSCFHAFPLYKHEDAREEE